MKRNSAQSGFSAAELLISLFIAVAFIGAGYQLYAVILRDGSDAKLRARANDIAYDKLRFYSDQATNPCTTVTTTSPTPLNPTPALPNPSGLPPNATIDVQISCPYPNPDPTSKISVTVKYGTPLQEVTHAVFVNK